MSIQTVSSHALPSPCRRYDVFLSFRGEETRKNFTSHLYSTLNQKGINVFRDDNKLERGKSMSPELFKAIEESKCSVIVFSKNYADSTWCLEELVKIVECKDRSIDPQIVFPIFYDVEPTIVRKQIGNFQQAFAKHEDALQQNIKKVEEWRHALKEVANISGWELKERNESEFIEDIVKDISSKLIPRKFEAHKGLVGINSPLEELMLLLDTKSNGVRMIGIYGMGGLGKTTIARVVFDSISSEFEGSSFLANVREISEKGSLISLQKQILYDLLKLADGNIWNIFEGVNMIGSRLRQKKVLLVIDDVIDKMQLESLVGKHDWFGSGSRIIMTSRDKHLLMTHGVDVVYKLEELNDDEAIRLFCLNAFKTHQPMKEYEQLSKRALKYATGLPLALKVLGSFLYGRTIQEWESALQRLKRDPTNQIMRILQISFDGLQEIEKKIFLDIACFFKGNDKDYVTKILEGCDLDPTIGIPVLIEKSLMYISDHKVCMHDLLQEMGQYIVKRESDEPEKRTRLWEKANIHRVLLENTGTKEIEGIMLNCRKDEAYLSANVMSFSRMTKLRLLKIYNVVLPRLEYLSNEIRLLEWHGYPLESLPSNLQLEKTVALTMPHSNIKQLWITIRPLNNLAFMRFSHSRNLMRTPDLTGVPNLEELILEGCIRLCEIHPSLLVHKKVIILNLKDCISLRTLPGKIAMESLRKLVLSGCSKLRKFPKIEGRMECLSELSLDGTAIDELPLSIELLSRLAFLDLNDCKNLVRLPSTINGLKSLRTLKLSGCSKLENVPENLGTVESLEELDISGTAIRNPVSSIFLLKNLKSLSFRGCKGSPTSFSWFSLFPVNLKPRSSDPAGLVLPSLSGLSSLARLDLSDCNLGEGGIPIDICNLFSLKHLNLSKNNFVSLPETINRLSKLEILMLKDCKRLESLLELPSNIKEVRVDGCASLERVSDALKSRDSAFLRIHSVNCLKLLGSNDLAFAVLKGFLEAESNPTTRFSIVVPGSKIPEWFRYQNKGSTITIARAPDSYYKKKLGGYAICSIFHVHRHPSIFRENLVYATHMLNCHMKADKMESSTSFCTEFDEELGQPLSDHLWLLYLPNEKLHDVEWNFESGHVELSFRAWRGPGLEVKRCGVHPIYVDEVEEFNQKTEEWRTSKIWNVNESDDQVSVGSTMDVARISKRSLTEYAEADATEEHPLPKRFKELE